jgi:hypothetical protein
MGTWTGLTSVFPDSASHVPVHPRAPTVISSPGHLRSTPSAISAWPSSPVTPVWVLMYWRGTLSTSHVHNRRPAHFSGVVVYNDARRNIRVDEVVGVVCVVLFLVLGLHVEQLVDAVRFSTDTLSTGQERSSLGKRRHIGKVTNTRRLGTRGQTLHGALRCRRSFRAFLI